MALEQRINVGGNYNERWMVSSVIWAVAHSLRLAIRNLLTESAKTPVELLTPK